MMPPELEAEIMKSEYAGMYVLGKCLQYFARLKSDERRITFLRVETMLEAHGVNVRRKCRD